MDEKLFADARATAPAGKTAITLGAALDPPPGRMIAGSATMQVARGSRGALLGPPPRRRRH